MSLRICCLMVLWIPLGLMAQWKEIQKSESQVIQNAETYEGFFDFYYVEEKDVIYLEVKSLEKEFLFVSSLSQGIGSNDIGLDRGQLGANRVVYFKKAGNKLLLMQPNLTYRAITENKLEKQSVQEAFAKSVLYGFPIEENYGTSFLIDVTPFLMEDHQGVSQRLSQTEQGNYQLDTSRSAIELSRVKAFPKNVEFDVLQTFKGQSKGAWIRSVTPHANLVTVHQHYSFIELPDSNFELREFDSRAGSIPFVFFDYASQIHEPISKKYIIRHRLEKKNPQSEVSEAVEPIIYYLDNGAPEPIRSALLDGAKWWNQAFEAIGYKDAFQVKVLPAGADPLDVRYNVIQWVHRSTRGWSYGASVVDPRTGEIIKGHVSLGSLRVRQDYMIALGLTKNPFQENSELNQKALDLALARIRQLSAHEIGHTLGFAHNFASSTRNRSSVMDYPHPKLNVVNNQISLEDAYDDKIGAWDQVSVAYAYSDFPDGMDHKKALNDILETAITNGETFITDADARPLGGAHPKAHLWDNGYDVIQETEKILQIRNHALENFSLNHLRENESYALLSDRLVPIYLMHRYQAEALVKLIGGVDYDYGVKGNIESKVEIIDSNLQRKALKVFQQMLSPQELKIPKHLRRYLLPRPYGYPNTRENLLSQTSVVFDYLGATNTLSDRLIQMLLQPQRASRLVQQAGLNKNQLSLPNLIESLIDMTFHSKFKSMHEKQINQIVQQNLLKHLMKLGRDSSVYGQVNAIVYQQLEDLSQLFEKDNDMEYGNYYLHSIKHYLKHLHVVTESKSQRIPDGAPIGTIYCDYEIW
ncbi:MAG: zinc-dependent metalloprotease [Flavobacteriaceae bacterium]|nr:zinc-dependent metalloprotease [Flavobacteriaceae bacterium]